MAAMILCSLWGGLVGCDRDTDQKPIVSTKPDGHHGGHAVKVSEDPSVEMELTLDEDRSLMVIYVQATKSHAPHALSVDRLNGSFESGGQVFDVTFKPDPRSGDPEGRSSRFVIDLDQLPQQLVHSNHFTLGLSYQVDGSSFNASIPHRNDHSHEYLHD